MMDDRDLIRQVYKLRQDVDGIIKPETSRPVGVLVYNDADLTIANNTTTTLTFNSERLDDVGFHSTVSNTGRLTVPTGYSGWYAISAHVRWAASAVGSRRQVLIMFNNSVYIAEQLLPPSTTTVTSIAVPSVYFLSQGDFLTVDVVQDSGGNLNVVSTANISPEFRMVKLPFRG